MGDINNNKLASVALLHLPTSPDTLLQLIEECAQASPDFTALEQCVAQDVALAIRVLDLASAQSPHQRIGRLAELIEHVGVDAMRTLAMTCAVNTVLDERAAGAARAQMQLRSESVYRAALAQELARRTGYPALGEAYLAGLLQSVGELWLLAQQYSASESPGDTVRMISYQSVRQLEFDSLLPDALLYCREDASKLGATHPLIQLAYAAWALSSVPSPAESIGHAARLLNLSEGSLSEVVANTRDEMIQFSTQQGDVASQTRRWHDARAQLVEYVRQQGLLSNTRPKFSQGEGVAVTLNSVRKALHSLFGFRRSAAFMYDADRNNLQGLPLGPDPISLGELSLPCVPGVSSLCDAILQQRAINISDVGAPLLIDQMLLRLLGYGGFTCLPLATTQRKLGVLVVCTDAATAPVTESQKQLLITFAQQASFALARELGSTQVSTLTAPTVTNKTLARVADELSNPLTIMKNYVKILRLRLAREDAAQSSLSVLDEELDHVSDIVRAADAAPQASVESTPGCDVNGLIMDIVRNEAAAWNQHLRTVLRTDLRHNLPTIDADIASLRQVLLNLLRNAAESMPAGGEVIVATRANYLSEDGKQCVEIIVKDNGPGIPPQVLARLFQPVRSTKSRQHAGLGLHIVRNLVLHMGGIVQCRSSAARGTLFQILLPQQAAQQ